MGILCCSTTWNAILHVLQINSDLKLNLLNIVGTIIAIILRMHGMNILIGLSVRLCRISVNLPKQKIHKEILVCRSYDE